VRLILAALAVAFTLPFAACTKKNSGNPNTLNLYTVAKIKGYDPALAEDNYSNVEIERVYETLYTYHPFKRPYTVEPLLAEGMPTVSKDNLTYTIKLRKGIRFIDDAAFPNGKGREINAKDFVYSLKRLADPRVQSTGFWILESRIRGLDEWHAKYTKDTASKPNYDEEIEGLKALDDSTVQIILKQPYPQLLNVLVMPYTAVVAKEAVEKYGPEFINHAVGTGPFILSDYNPGDHMTYVKNPAYWGKFPADGGEDAGKQLPLVDGVNVRVIVEQQPAWLHFKKGELDFMAIPKDNFATAVSVVDKDKPVTVENLKLGDELAQKHIELYGAVAMDLTYTAFNTESKEIPQLKNKKVRQAISLALDEREAISLFYNGAATLSQTPIPPGLNGYDPEFKNPYRTGDIEQAKKLLAEAGFPEGKGIPEIPYDIGPSTTDKQIYEYAQKQFDKIGIKTKPLVNVWPALLKRIQNREAQIWGLAWGADYPDAENFLQLFYGPNATPGGMNNSYYKNKDFDALFSKARILPDSPARTEMYKKLGRMVAEDCPVILGVHRMAIAVRQPWIKNGMYDEFPYPRAKYIRIDLETKKKAQE
jgi:oligopeptide transport system substrate-binding protein